MANVCMCLGHHRLLQRHQPRLLEAPPLLLQHLYQSILHSLLASHGLTSYSLELTPRSTGIDVYSEYNFLFICRHFLSRGQLDVLLTACYIVSTGAPIILISLTCLR